VLITALYILATVAMLVALPQTQIFSLDGFMRSIETASDRVGIGWVTPVVAGLIVMGGLGQAGAWFAASGRLPFVAGIDRFLPAAFREDPPALPLAIREPADPGGNRGGVHLLLHPLPLHVRFHDPFAA
jgi:hypothetical protein